MKREQCYNCVFLDKNYCNFHKESIDCIVYESDEGVQCGCPHKHWD